MVEKVKRVVWRTGKLSLMILGAFGVLSVILAGLFVWRVSSRPLDISFAKNTIEAAIYDKTTGSYARMGKTVLFWPDLDGPLYLQIHNGQFFNKDGVLIGSTGQIDVSFFGIGLLMGRILPKAIIIKEPSVRLERKEDGSLSFDIGSEEEQASTKEIADGGNAKAVIREMLSHIAGPVREGGIMSGSLLSRLRGFSIENARLFVDDKVLQQTWSLPDFDLAFMNTGEGAGGFAHMTLPGSETEGPVLDISIEYDWWHGDIELSTDVIALNVNDIISKIPALDMPATQDAVISAHIEVILDDLNFMPSEVRIDAYSEGGEISHSMLSDDPIPYKDLALSLLYDYGGKVMQLRNTRVSLGGIQFEFSGDLTREEEKISGPVRIWTKDVEHGSIGEIWPKFLKGDDAEKWVVQRMADGVFEQVSVAFDLVVEKQIDQLPVSQIEPEAGDIDFDFEFVPNIEDEHREGAAFKIEPEPEPELEPEENWYADVKNVLVDFKARDMTLDYHAPLPKAYHIYGSGQLDVDNDSLSVDIEKAQIGGMDVGVSKIYFDELIAEGVGDADMRFEVKSSVANVLRYISNDPINLGETGMDIDHVKGDAALKVWLHFPARKSVLMSEFKIDISGSLNDVVFPGVVRDLDIKGGPLQIAVKDNHVKMKGSALLDGHEMGLVWETFLKSKGQAYKEKVEARLLVGEELREKLGIDLTEFLSGSLGTELTYTSYRDGTADAQVSADITPALLFIDPFDYEKPQGQDGKVSLDAYFEDGVLQKITNLSVQAPDFMLRKGEVLFTTLPAAKEGEEVEIALASGSTPQFTLGETKSSLKFAYDKNRTVDIALEGEFLDAQPFMDAEETQEEYDVPAMRIAVKAGKVRTAPKQLAENVRAYLMIDEQGRFDRIEIDGHIGASDVFVRFNEEGNREGKRTFRMKTEDAGAFLKAFGVYKNVVGGTMAIYGEPIRGIYDRNIRGRAEISDFKVVKAPALAKLLSLLSLGGIAEVLANDGLRFDKMEVDFSWLYRKQGSLLKLEKGRTSGNTLGILFEGTFDNHKRVIDVSGTIAPMNTLNKILNAIPLIGSILTGGEGRGMFAATYSIKGSSDDPQISVNPLSVITPGILRRILWE